MRFDASIPAADPQDADPFGLEAVARCLAAAPARERAILVQTYYAERTATEIATAIGMTAGAVRVARHRALESMRTCVESRRLA